MALSNLGLISMGGAMLRPGGGLGDGFLAYGHGMQQDAQMQATNAYRQAQMQQMKAMEDERRMKIASAQQQQEAMRQFMQSLGGQQTPAQATQPQSMNGALGSGTYGIDPLPAMSQKMAQTTPAEASQPAPKWDAMKLLMGLKAGLKREDIEAMANAGTLGMPEVARTIEQADNMGNPQTGQYDKFGRPVGSPLNKPVQLDLKDLGGQFQRYNAYTGGLVGNKVDKTMSPDAVASNRLGWANNAETRRHNTFNENNPIMSPVTTEDGVFSVPQRGGVARPVVGPDGKPLAGKAPNDTQSTAAIFANRAIKSNAILDNLASEGTILPGQIKGAASSVPFIGGALEATVNAAPTYLGGPTSAQQKVEQAQRDFVNATLRKESGAVINPEEFVNAKKQYFPQLGDSPEVIQQKSENRRSAIAGLSQASGSALHRVQSMQDAMPPAKNAQTAQGKISGTKVDALPEPTAAPVGAVATDNATGQKFRNTGSKWEPMQ